DQSADVVGLTVGLLRVLRLAVQDLVETLPVRLDVREDLGDGHTDARPRESLRGVASRDAVAPVHDDLHSSTRGGRVSASRVDGGAYERAGRAAVAALRVHMRASRRAG